MSSLLHRPTKLITDFRDQYDYFFDYTGEPFVRMANAGMSRSDALGYLSRLGFAVPDNGTVEDLLACYRSETVVVVYTDEMKHRGEGKVLSSLGEAVRKYPQHWASLYHYDIECPMHKGSKNPHGSWSMRYLQIGYMKFWLEYWSNDDWRSNCGDGGVRVVAREGDGYHPKIDLPLWAIDFVVTQHSWFAVDFNSAPGLMNTGIPERLGSRPIVEAISEAIYRRKENEADLHVEELTNPPSANTVEVLV